MIHIKNPKSGEIFKIACLDDVLISREKLIQYKAEGYQGYNIKKEEYNNDLEMVLNDSDSVYNLLEEYPGLENIEVYLPTPNTLIHDKVIIMHYGYQYKVECKESGNRVIKAKVAGERWRNGLKRTIFECRCCGRKFSTSHVYSELLKNLYPDYLGAFNAENDTDAIKRFRKTGMEYQKLSLIEVLELLAGEHQYTHFHSLVSHSTLVNDEIKKYGYPTLWNFFLTVNKLKPAIYENLLEQVVQYTGGVG